VVEKHPIPEQREQDSNCGEQRQSEGSTSTITLTAKELSISRSSHGHGDDCAITNNFVTPTRMPMNSYSSDLPILPLLPPAGTVTVTGAKSNANLDEGVPTVVQLQHEHEHEHGHKGVPSVVQLQHNSSHKEIHVSASDDLPSLTTSTGTSEEATISVNTKDTDTDTDKEHTPPANYNENNKNNENNENNTNKNITGITQNQHLTGNNVCYPKNAAAHSPSHLLSQITNPGRYYPPQTSPYANHHPIMMGPLHHGHAPFPMHPYQHWPHHSYGYPYGGYTGRGYSTQVSPLFSNPYGTQSLPPSSISPPYNNTKSNQRLAEKEVADKSSADKNTTDKDTAPKSQPVPEGEGGEKPDGSLTATVTSISGSGNNNANTECETGKELEQLSQVTQYTEKIDCSPLRRRHDLHDECDHIRIKEMDEGFSKSLQPDKEKTGDESCAAKLDDVRIEAAAAENEKTPNCDTKRHCNEISPDLNSTNNCTEGNNDGKKNIEENDESPKKKLKECKTDNDEKQLLAECSGETSKRFSTSHVPTHSPFYPAHPHYMPPTGMPVQHGAYPYCGMMPRYDHMHPYSAGGGFCGRYPGAPYSLYGPRFSGHMQGGWGNGGVRGPTPYPPYPHEFSPAPNSKTPGDKESGLNLSKNKIAGIAEHIERHQALTKNATVGKDASLSNQEINRVKSAERCIRMSQPHPTKFWSEKETNDTVIPDFQQLVNYPTYINKNRAPLTSGNPNQVGTRFCVMCGKERKCTYPSLNANGSSRARQGKSAVHFAGCYSSCDDEDRSLHIIPRQNKGLCTSCDVAVWVVIKSKLEIKWCKGCKNFKPWAAFGDKGHATKCVRCRERQREKYATKKELMMKNRDEWKLKKDSDDSDRDEVKDIEDSPKRIFSPRDHGGLSCLLAATAQVTSSLQQGVDA